MHITHSYFEDEAAVFLITIRNCVIGWVFPDAAFIVAQKRG